jgi:DNA-directed RNA polymerase subunit omega
MRTELLNSASDVIPNIQTLVNVISRRVRQLILGHRPLVHTPPGTDFSDIALIEVIKKKLTYESAKDDQPKGQVAPIVQFRGVIPSRKAA